MTRTLTEDFKDSSQRYARLPQWSTACPVTLGCHTIPKSAPTQKPQPKGTPGTEFKQRVLFIKPVFKTYLFIFPETSLSFMKHSIFSGMSVLLELISFFNFSHSWYRRRSARILDFASNLYLALNSAQKCSTNFSSKFFPPKKGSKAVPST